MQQVYHAPVTARLAFSALIVTASLAASVLWSSIQGEFIPIEEVPLLQSTEGPVITGLFGRYGDTPLATCGSEVNCPPGSHVGPLACCNDNSKHITAPGCGPYFCNYSYCGYTEKPTCCAGGCIQDYPPTCAGCERTGYCSH